MQYNFFRVTLPLIILLGLARHALPQEPVAQELFDHAKAIRVLGHHAFVVSGCGLFIYDITDKTKPVLNSSLLLNDNTSFDLELSPPFAFVLSGQLPSETATITAIRISNRSKPAIVARYQGFPDGAQVKDFILRGQTLIVSNGNLLHFLDVSDPKSIREISRLQIVNEKATIPVLVRDGSVIYALFRHSKGSGIAAVETINPANPQILSRIRYARKDSEGNLILPLSLAVSNHVLYVSIANKPISIYNVNNPNDPQASGSASTIASGLKAEGLFLFAETTGGTRLAIYDTSTPLTPRFVREVDWSGNTSAMEFDPVQLQAYVQWTELGRPGFAILRLTSAATFEQQSLVSDIIVTDVEEQGGITYITGSNKLGAMRRLSGKKLEEIGNIAFFESLGSLEIENSRVYVSTLDSDGIPGIQSIDVSDPVHMRELGFLELNPAEIPIEETQPRFDVQQNIMVIAFKKEGMAIFEITGGNFQRISTFRIPGNERSLNATIQGDTAYLCTSRGNQLNLYVIDVSDPARPDLISKVSNFDQADAINDLKVDGNFLYIVEAGKVVRQTKSSGKLVIFSVEDPARPALLSKTFTGSDPEDRSGAAEEIQIHDDVAYVADGVVGISVFDVSDRSHPEFVHAINTPSYVRGVSVDAQELIHTADFSCYLIFR